METTKARWCSPGLLNTEYIDGSEQDGSISNGDITPEQHKQLIDWYLLFKI